MEPIEFGTYVITYTCTDFTLKSTSAPVIITGTQDRRVVHRVTVVLLIILFKLFCLLGSKI